MNQCMAKARVVCRVADSGSILSVPIVHVLCVYQLDPALWIVVPLNRGCCGVSRYVAGIGTLLLQNKLLAMFGASATVATTVALANS